MRKVSARTEGLSNQVDGSLEMLPNSVLQADQSGVVEGMEIGLILPMPPEDGQVPEGTTGWMAPNETQNTWTLSSEWQNQIQQPQLHLPPVSNALHIWT